MRELIRAFPACALALACASSPKPVQKVDDSGLGRLDDSQMQPVDDARVEQGRAQDALSRARANEADAQARVGESQVREAQLRKQAADLRASAVDAYNKWQQTDARVRTLARPEPMPVPPPTGPESTR